MKLYQKIASEVESVVGARGGLPHLVTIHETHEPAFSGPYRFYLAVDRRFKERDLLRESGWRGLSRTEANREAASLSNKLKWAVEALTRAESAFGLKGQDILVARCKRKLETLLMPYNAELI